MKLRAVLLIIGVTTALAAFAPAGAGAATLHGVVVARQHGTMLVAGPNGLVQAVRGTAAVGSRVEGSRVVGHASRTRIHGVVVKRVGRTTFLSSNRHLLAVSTTDPTPAPTGSVVDSTVTVQSNGELDDQNENEVGHVSGDLTIQATVTAVGAGTVTLTVNGQSVTVSLPNGLTLPATVVGQTVTLHVSLNGDDQGDDEGDDSGDQHGGGGGDD